ncbi:MAG: class I SAM-dependent methyltransferase [Kiritimatiellae bacterium]|nr:class I SAM-dependent methyltransferase [Kiritimatiellia bacterium]
MQVNEYELLDSGDGKKLERFGPVVLARPCAQAVWAPRHPERWKRATAAFDRNDGLNWSGRERMPESWIVPIQGIRMKLSTTDFGHLGVFPETRAQWEWIEQTLSAIQKEAGRPLNFLNLFAYSGGATLAAAKAGATCCHLDASKGMVDWARENAALNQLQDAPIRWIVDDVNKFLQREIRRGRKYDAVLLDPPSFGRGRKGELYKVEKDLMDTLSNVRQVLSTEPAFVLLTSHTPGFSPLVLRNLLEQSFGSECLKCGEMLLTGSADTLLLPNGTWARWVDPRWKAASCNL